MEITKRSNTFLPADGVSQIKEMNLLKHLHKLIENLRQMRLKLYKLRQMADVALKKLNKGNGHIIKT